MSIGVDTAQQDSFIVILNFLKHICIVFKIYIYVLYWTEIYRLSFFVSGQFTIKSNYVLCGYSVRQRIYKLNVFIYLMSYVVENFITLHSMNIVLGHTIKNTEPVIGIAIYNHLFEK